VVPPYAGAMASAINSAACTTARVPDMGTPSSHQTG
jgi:hypothetical protein